MKKKNRVEIAFSLYNYNNAICTHIFEVEKIQVISQFSNINGGSKKWK